MNDNIKTGADINAGDGGYSEGTQEKYDEFVKGRNPGKMRIKELAIQSGLPTALDYHQKRYEKFAELIVRECMKLNSKELSITAIERLLPLYREHFGIEE